MGTTDWDAGHDLAGLNLTDLRTIVRYFQNLTLPVDQTCLKGLFLHYPDLFDASSSQWELIEPLLTTLNQWDCISDAVALKKQRIRVKDILSTLQ